MHHIFHSKILNYTAVTFYLINYMTKDSFLNAIGIYCNFRLTSYNFQIAFYFTIYEPTGNLDSKNSQEIVQLLKYSNRHYGQTLIVITHDESIALQADRIIAIEDGKIVRDERVRA